MYLTHFASAQNYEAAMRQVPLTMDGKGRVILEYLKFLLKDDAARSNYSDIKNTVDSFWKELGLLSRNESDEHNHGLDTEFYPAVSCL
ncbi:hypothetical protein BKA69DRAFT_1067006 [Paraphysoderma sedebokerense]|nr:hypothetical protein BKA69DRAFT_1067006 [Paraphysoderma sedebokerense]